MQNGRATDMNFLFDNIPFKMVFVKGGLLQMGCGTFVALQDFYIGEKEVTQGLWQVVMGTSIFQQKRNACSSQAMYGVGREYPMYYVNYYESMEFCRKLSDKLKKELPLGYDFCLPTEAQWVYAARGGDMSRSYIYAGSNNIAEVAYFSDNSNFTAHEVGGKEPNELGLYDMCGNVWEWCSDIYNKSAHCNGDITLPCGLEDSDTNSYRVLRGGGWYDFAESCRLDSACYDSPYTQSMHIGFRMAMSIQ